MLTDREIEKLMQTDSPRDKDNDFIARRKFKKWLDGLFVVSVYILRYLPHRQLKKIITYHHIQEMIQILWSFVCIWGVVPIVQKDEHTYLALPRDSPPREAESIERLITGDLRLFILNLFTLMSAEDVREIMQTEVSRRHHDYVLKKKDEPPK